MKLIPVRLSKNITCGSRYRLAVHRPTPQILKAVSLGRRAKIHNNDHNNNNTDMVKNRQDLTKDLCLSCVCVWADALALRSISFAIMTIFAQMEHLI